MIWQLWLTRIFSRRSITEIGLETSALNYENNQIGIFVVDEIIYIFVLTLYMTYREWSLPEMFLIITPHSRKVF